jgi:hypothetical protein
MGRREHLPGKLLTSFRQQMAGFIGQFSLTGVACIYWLK